MTFSNLFVLFLILAAVAGVVGLFAIGSLQRRILDQAGLARPRKSEPTRRSGKPDDVPKCKRASVGHTTAKGAEDYANVFWAIGLGINLSNPPLSP
jgi:hypothetical protein